MSIDHLPSEQAEFLHFPQGDNEKKKRPTKKIILIVVLAFVIAWTLSIIIAAGAVFASAQSGKGSIFSARDFASELNFEKAKNEIESAANAFARTQKGFTVLQSLSFIPWAGDQIQGVKQLMLSGSKALESIAQMIDLAEDLIALSGLTSDDIIAMSQGIKPSITFDELPSETKREILRRLSASSDDIALIQAKIAIALAELDSIPKGKLVGPIRMALDPYEQKLREAEFLLSDLSVLSKVLPELAGLDQTKEFLLLFINNAELRPGGGFIGTYGELKVQDGDILMLETKDVYSLDRLAQGSINIQAPIPLQKYNAVGEWLLRDSNWSPDYEMSSRQSLDLYKKELAVSGQTASIDGVIGFTPDYASRLLEITGPITVRGQTFDADNVLDKLEYQVEIGYKGQEIPEAQRKEILADLVNALKTKLYQLPFSQWEKVLSATADALEMKQLVFFSMNPFVQNVYNQAGWSGKVNAKTVDAQMVVDANLASLKTDPVMDKKILYEIFQNSAGEFIGRTKISYSHTGDFDWKTTRYRTYTRLYVPVGTVHVRTQGSMLNDKILDPQGREGQTQIENELGMTSFGTFISIEPGETKDLIFEYKLAPQVIDAIESGNYSLTYIKQVGEQNKQLTLDLNFDKTISYATPPELSPHWGDQKYQLNTILGQDKKFEVSF
ncbi:MAG: DUF4012 domain-containing protein [Patescibacteria group bacterium]